MSAIFERHRKTIQFVLSLGLILLIAAATTLLARAIYGRAPGSLAWAPGQATATPTPTFLAYPAPPTAAPYPAPAVEEAYPPAAVTSTPAGAYPAPQPTANAAYPPPQATVPIALPTTTPTETLLVVTPDAGTPSPTPQETSTPVSPSPTPLDAYPGPLVTPEQNSGYPGPVATPTAAAQLPTPTSAGPYPAPVNPTPVATLLPTPTLPGGEGAQPTLSPTAVFSPSQVITTTRAILLPALTLPYSETQVLADGRVNQVAFSPVTNTLAVATSGGVWVYDVATSNPLLRLSAGSPVLSLAFEPAGRALVTGGLTPNIQWWQPLTGQFLGVQRAHQMGIVDLAFIPQSALIASASDDATVAVWNASTFGAPIGAGEQPLSVLRGAPQRLTALAASGDGGLLAASSFGQVLVWNPSSGELLQTLPHNGWVACLAFTPDGQSLLTAEAGNRLQTWQRNGWRRTQVTLIVGWSAIRALAYSPDGNILVTGHSDGSILFWDVASGELRFWLAGHPKTITSLAFDRTGSRLASASADGSVRIWNLKIQE